MAYIMGTMRHMNASSTDQPRPDETFMDFLSRAMAPQVGVISDSKLARMLDLNQSSVSRWRNVGQRPHPDVLRRMADTFDLDILPLFVAAGYLTQKEAGLTTFEVGLDKYSFDVLMGEISKRYHEQSESGQ